jgi:hypothetical protein
MKAWDLVSDWTLTRAAGLHDAANKAERAYQTNPLKDACAAYAATLRRAAADLENAARAFRERQGHGTLDTSSNHTEGT